ncbi:TetR/AcrR family transcriptional regulator [Neisseria sp. CCUG12390]|uniref:TetR/AcrR family transcriptional regulator n=1 Tax=Neisseria sp. CCUG12390 TaxID=3392035 RepID=UPI003A10030A
MNSVTAMQLVRAGIKLYPTHGYDGLNAEVIAKYLNISPKIYENLFPDKDDFIKIMLQEFNAYSIGRLSFDCTPQMTPIERLHQIIWRLAVALRCNLDWTHRMLLDSYLDVKIIKRALKIQNEIIARGLMKLLRECYEEQKISDLELQNRYEFLKGAVLMPLIMTDREEKMGVLLDELGSNVPNLMTDAHIQQRINWAFKALFGK